MKKIAITGKTPQLANDLQSCLSGNSKIEVCVAMEYGEDFLRNLAFAQPEFVVVDLINVEEARNILEQCLDTTIVFITDDINRSSYIISDLNKEGYFNFINLDKNKITPKEVIKQLEDYEVTSDMFEEVNLNDLNTTPTETTSTVENNSNPSLVEEMPLENNNFTEEIDSAPQDNIEIKAENVSNTPSHNSVLFGDDVKVDQSKAMGAIKLEGLKINDEQINAVSQSQVISVYSKKGGTGKTTIFISKYRYYRCSIKI